MDRQIRRGKKGTEAKEIGPISNETGNHDKVETVTVGVEVGGSGVQRPAQGAPLTAQGGKILAPPIVTATNSPKVTK